jgi:predicted phosphoribosyltransferase
LNGRTVIVTDDGVATGATMQAALWTSGREEPKELIAAVPVGAERAVRSLADHADEVVVLRVPGDLGAIGQFYRNFEQTRDDEVVDMLKGRDQEPKGPAHRSLDFPGTKFR